MNVCVHQHSVELRFLRTQHNVITQAEKLSSLKDRFSVSDIATQVLYRDQITSLTVQFKCIKSQQHIDLLFTTMDKAENQLNVFNFEHIEML